MLMTKWSSENIKNALPKFERNPGLLREIVFRRFRLVAILLVIGLVIGFAAKPAYHAWREHRIDQNLEDARAAARLEDWPAARSAARSVIIARPSDYDAFRIWTLALSRLGEPRTYLAATQLFTDERATSEHRREALRIMALQAPEAITFRAWASLDPEIRGSLGYRAAVAPMLTRRGAGAIVVRELGDAPDLESDFDARLELIRALTSRPTDDNLAEARERFAALIEDGAGTEALEALLILGETPGGLAKGTPLPDLRRWVTSEPEATTLHHLVALHPEIHALQEEAGSVDSIFREAVERYADLDPGVLGSWLIRHNQGQRAAEFLEEREIKTSEAYVALLHALLRTDREDELREKIADPPPYVDLVEVSLIRAMLARRRGNEASEQTAWEQALDYASFDSDRNRFLEIARYAESLGADRAAEDAWVAGIRVGWGLIPLYADLRPRFAGLAAKDRSADLLAMFRTLIRFEPENPELVQNFFYLGVIHNIVEPSVAVDRLRALLEAHEDRPEFASSLAFAHLAANQPRKALDLIPTVRSSDLISPMMADALEGTALALTDSPETALPLLETVDWDRFLRQERVAFREILTSHEIANLPLPLLETTLPDDYDPAEAPAWRKAIEAAEKARETDTLPPLPPLEVPEMPEVPELPEG